MTLEEKLEEELTDVVDKIENRFQNLKAEQYWIYSFGSYNSKNKEEFDSNSSDIDLIAIADEKTIEKIATEGGDKESSEKIQVRYKPSNWFKGIEKFRSRALWDKFELDNWALADMVLLYYIANSAKRLRTNTNVDIIDNVKKDPRLAKNRADPKEGYKLFVSSTRNLIEGKISKAALKAAYSLNLAFDMGFLNMYKEILEVKDMFFGAPKYDNFSMLIDAAYKLKKEKKEFELNANNYIFKLESGEEISISIGTIWDYFDTIRKAVNARAKELQYCFDEELVKKLDDYFRETTPLLIPKLEELVKNDEGVRLAQFYAEELADYLLKNESVIPQANTVLQKVLEHIKNSEGPETKLLTAKINIILANYEEAKSLMENIQKDFLANIESQTTSYFTSYFDLDKNMSKSEFWLNLGKAYFGAGKITNKLDYFEEASKCFKTSILEDPINNLTNTSIWNNILECYKKEGKFKKEDIESIGKFISDLEKVKKSPERLIEFKFESLPRAVDFDKYIEKTKEYITKKLDEFSRKIDNKLNVIDEDINRCKLESEDHEHNSFVYKTIECRLYKREKEIFERLKNENNACLEKLLDMDSDGAMLVHHIQFFKDYLNLQIKWINRANNYELRGRILKNNKMSEKKIAYSEAFMDVRELKVTQKTKEKQELLVEACAKSGFIYLVEDYSREFKLDDKYIDLVKKQAEEYKKYI